MTKKEVLKVVSEVYIKLDNILSDVDNVRTTVRECFNMLEEIPSDVKDIEED